MVGPFDQLGLPNYKNEQTGIINAPLPFLPSPLPKGFHGGKDGKLRIKPKDSLKQDMFSPEFIEQMRKLGKVPAGKSKTSIEFVIYNDASRPPHETETEEVFYAKFIEYGFHYRKKQEDGSIGMEFKAGLHLWKQVRKFLARKLVANYKKMPRRYTIKSVTMAIRDAVEETTLKLMDLTPVDTALMKNSWKFEQIK